MQADADGPAGALRSLHWLARVLLNRDLVLQPRPCPRTPEPPPRAVLTPGHLLLPFDDTACDPVDRHHLDRATVAHAVAHLKFSAPAIPSKGLKPMTVALVSAIEDARVERLLLREHPGMRGWFIDPLRRALQPDGLGFAALLSRMDLALMDPLYPDDHHWVGKARALFEQQAADLHDHAGFRRIATILAHDLGQMRVAFRPGQYWVSAAHRDDNTYLWAHAVSQVDPPPPLELAVPPPPPAPAQAARSPEDRTPAHDTEALAVTRHAHPEWDHRRALLRLDWCTVLDMPAPWWHGSATDPAAGLPVTLLPLQRPRRSFQGRRLKRQRDGDELDLDAVIAFMAERRAGALAEPRCLTRPATTEVPASILVLLDLSESTKDSVSGTGPSFLDIEKQAALMLARAVAAQGDRIAVDGFSSNTRAEVSYFRLLAFGQPLDARACALVSSAPARHSTRMGAALRHATASLAGEPHGLKAIIVLTDGVPSDIDVHEPRYLIEDARHAVLAARAVGVQVHALTLDQGADTGVRRIFGGRNHRAVVDASALPARLCGLYREVTAA